VDKKASARRTARRAYGQSFLAGRNFGVNLGHAIGFEAGYEKGYAEGSTLGYNNGFLAALRLVEEGEGTKGDGSPDLIVALLEGLAAGGAVTVTVTGRASREAATLFALLGITARTGPTVG